jgi:hypothetical protein
MKNGKPHEVPLTPLAAALLPERQPDRRTIRIQQEGRSDFSGWSHAKDKLDQRSGVTGWVLP